LDLLNLEVFSCSHDELWSVSALDQVSRESVRGLSCGVGLNVDDEGFNLKAVTEDFSFWDFSGANAFAIEFSSEGNWPILEFSC
jgi:hypothetical protein